MAPIPHKDFFILLTDDDEDDREIFEETIKDLERDAKVLTLNDGKQLMDYLSDTSNPLPDILFLDINMPHKDGHQSLREIRADSRLRQLCVLMYSTSDYSNDVQKAYEIGADGFIQKPSSHRKLKEILQKVIDTDWKNPCASLDKLPFLLKP
ncbi:hypothetical protein LCGC14_1714280 [marine sediment metagenome]|uniref:Response regulator n=2 Tax=root TaxID=1 RepID=A0A831QMQ2_9FLAO|nr:response regulator [Pricia sp.]HEA19551.1 response regulator [Pricia antarctica]